MDTSVVGFVDVGADATRNRTAVRCVGKNRARADTNGNVRTAFAGDRAERAAVEAWRRCQLAEAGFPSRLSAALPGDGRVDVDALIDLVERGCPPELAARIAGPLDWEGPP
jgi:hypothetical protein